MNWETSFVELSVPAARQLGLVTAEQAERSGVAPSALALLSDAHLVMELDWAVYQLAGSPADAARDYAYAAWLALVPEQFAWERPAPAHTGAVLSHESAARLFGLGSPSAAGMAFTSPAPVQAPRACTVHTAALQAHEVTVRKGVPVTTPHRTIVDLVRSGTSHDEVGGVMADALRRDLVDLAALHGDVAPLADRRGFPAEGAAFVEHFLTQGGGALPPLSARNVRALADLRSPEAVERVLALIGALPADEGGSALTALGADPDFARGIAAEIVGRGEGLDG